MFVLNNEGGNVLQLFFIEDWYRILAPIFFLVLLGLKVILLLFKEGRNWSREKWALKSDWDLRHQSSLDKGKDNVWDLSHLALSIQQFTAGQPFSLFLYPHQGHFCIAFRQRRGVGRERERKKHPCEREISISCLLICTLTRDQTRNLGMCPDWKLNLWPFHLRDSTPTGPY